jgi:hypothetical protein
VLCSAEQRNFLNLPTKATQVIVFCPGAQRKILNLPTKATQIDYLLSSRAAKDFGKCHQTQLKLTVF